MSLKSIAADQAEGTKLVECPMCRGACKLQGFFPVYPDSVPQSERKGAVEIDCPDCLGEGKIPSWRMAWREEGEKLREDRIKRGKGLRAEAERRQMRTSDLSDMERGRIKPTRQPLEPNEIQDWISEMQATIERYEAAHQANLAEIDSLKKEVERATAVIERLQSNASDVIEDLKGRAASAAASAKAMTETVVGACEFLYQSPLQVPSFFDGHETNPSERLKLQLGHVVRISRENLATIEQQKEKIKQVWINSVIWKDGPETWRAYGVEGEAFRTFDAAVDAYRMKAGIEKPLACSQAEYDRLRAIENETAWGLSQLGFVGIVTAEAIASFLAKLKSQPPREKWACESCNEVVHVKSVKCGKCTATQSGTVKIPVASRETPAAKPDRDRMPFGSAWQEYHDFIKAAAENHYVSGHSLADSIHRAMSAASFVFSDQPGDEPEPKSEEHVTCGGQTVKATVPAGAKAADVAAAAIEDVKKSAGLLPPSMRPPKPNASGRMPDVTAWVNEPAQPEAVTALRPYGAGRETDLLDELESLPIPDGEWEWRQGTGVFLKGERTGLILSANPRGINRDLSAVALAKLDSDEMRAIAKLASKAKRLLAIAKSERERADSLKARAKVLEKENDRLNVRWNELTCHGLPDRLGRALEELRDTVFVLEPTERLRKIATEIHGFIGHQAAATGHAS